MRTAIMSMLRHSAAFLMTAALGAPAVAQGYHWPDKIPPEATKGARIALDIMISA